MLAGPVENSPQSAVNVLFSGPGWEEVRDGTRRAPSAGGFPPIDETRWLVAYEGAGRRVSVDRTRLTALGNDVFRVWEKWEAEAPLQDSEGEWYDATLTRVDYDCRGLRMRMIEVTTYNGGRVIDTVEIAPARQEWDSAVPESIGERTMRAACPVLRARR
ncbi:surface-adhesin E family protein [Longimicrobium sp.]|uniref:surface-adhesin E family protein n=1 Tax=Longimicrobium sp. TaxID=2029185 RepID=UPI002E32762C|nr:surface-adhesin E family protein [Longimicrobium sp.]